MQLTRSRLLVRPLDSTGRTLLVSDIGLGIREDGCEMTGVERRLVRVRSACVRLEAGSAKSEEKAQRPQDNVRARGCFPTTTCTRTVSNSELIPIV